MLPKHKRFFNILADLAEEFEVTFGTSENGSPVAMIREQEGDDCDTEYWYDINEELDNLLEGK